MKVSAVKILGYVMILLVVFLLVGATVVLFVKNNSAHADTSGTANNGALEVPVEPDREEEPSSTYYTYTFRSSPWYDYGKKMYTEKTVFRSDDVAFVRESITDPIVYNNQFLGWYVSDVLLRYTPELYLYSSSEVFDYCVNANKDVIAWACFAKSFDEFTIGPAYPIEMFYSLGLVSTLGVNFFDDSMYSASSNRYPFINQFYEGSYYRFYVKANKKNNEVWYYCKSIGGNLVLIPLDNEITIDLPAEVNIGRELYETGLSTVTLRPQDIMIGENSIISYEVDECDIFRTKEYADSYNELLKKHYYYGNYNASLFNAFVEENGVRIPIKTYFGGLIMFDDVYEIISLLDEAFLSADLIRWCEINGKSLPSN